MTRDEFLKKYPTGWDRWDREKAQALDALIESVRAETRAAILADEERRVWMEEYMHAIDGTNSAATARASAESMLEAWREARAAWEERDG